MRPISISSKNLRLGDISITPLGTQLVSIEANKQSKGPEHLLTLECHHNSLATTLFPPITTPWDLLAQTLVTVNTYPLGLFISPRYYPLTQDTSSLAPSHVSFSTLIFLG